MPLADLKKRLHSSLNRFQGKPQINIGGTEYDAVFSTLRVGEPIIFGGKDKTLDLTISVKQADVATQPAIGSTMTRTDKSTTHRVVGVTESAEGAWWVCETVRA